MKLFLHIGTNKTGSSYLQSTITLNKGVLSRSGIHVPDSKWDEAMLNGKITPGNGHELALCLSSDNRAIRLEKYFIGLYNAASMSKNDKVLLSNEMLIRFFSEKDILDDVINFAKIAGFQEVHCLCYFRNLYEHSLSLYKHRAKFGHHDDYKIWFATNYETLRLLEPFLNNIKESPCTFNFVPFEKDSKLIVTRLSNWLEFDINNLVLFKNEVNPSLSLNQIKWVQYFSSRYEGIAPKLYKALITVKNKEENLHLLNQFFNTANDYFNNYASTISAINSNFSAELNEKIDEKPIIKLTTKSEMGYLLTIDEYEKIEPVIKRFSSFYQINRAIYLVRYYGRRFYLKLQGKKKNNLDPNKFGGSLRN